MAPPKTRATGKTPVPEETPAAPKKTPAASKKKETATQRMSRMEAVLVELMQAVKDNARIPQILCILQW